MSTSGNISITHDIQPGDLGYVIYLHGKLYQETYHYGTGFEMYVAAGLAEFYRQYDPLRDRVWICEKDGTMVGFLLGMHREDHTAQLRYFLVEPGFRGLGLGKKLMACFMDYLRECRYTRAYLWTTDELRAAAALYKRHGFVLTEEKSSEAFGKKVNEQRYDLRLDHPNSKNSIT